MNNRMFLGGMSFLLIFGSALQSHPPKNTQASTKTLVLYDAASGSIPASTLMGFTDFPPGVASQTFSDGVTVMDTSITGMDTYAGWVSSQATTAGFPVLDRTMGVQVNFTLQVENETHTNNNRAGFSVVILDNDAKGIELAFWENEIWVQSDENTGGLFAHGEGSTFATTTGLIDYQVTIVGDTYTLTVNSNPLLTGPVRDYSKFEGFPDPYQTPNFLFLGDDTTSAQVRVRLQYLSVTGMEPVVPTATSVNTTTPSPEVSSTPLSTVTPLPSPTPVPTGRVFEFCPSAWIIGFMTIASALMIKGSKRRRSIHDDLT